MEELSPEQVCLTPLIVCAYILLEQYGSKLNPGDSVLLNAAHLSASGSSLLQLCICIFELQSRACAFSLFTFARFHHFSDAVPIV